MFLYFVLSAFVWSCNDEKTEPAATDAGSTTATTATDPADLPYKASYSSSWSTEVSDADLKMVMNTYKDWADGNMSGLAAGMADSVNVEFGTGDHFSGTNAELMKLWKTYRDSLSAVKIDMAGWHRMYSTDKKEGYIVTWYDEWDTYKDGRVDSATYHDINQVKNGKIVWYSQYKRKKK